MATRKSKPAKPKRAKRAKPRNKSVGRPTKRNAAIQKKILRNISNGLTHAQAARGAGIHIATFCEWRNKFPEFAEAVDCAMEEGIARRVERIEKAGRKGNWLADKWWLERVAKGQFQPPTFDPGEQIVPPSQQATFIVMPAMSQPKPPPKNITPQLPAPK